eukprot:2281986-Pyramimonas_sp.AAC.1
MAETLQKGGSHEAQRGCHRCLSDAPKTPRRYPRRSLGGPRSTRNSLTGISPPTQARWRDGPQATRILALQNRGKRTIHIHRVWPGPS